MQIVFVVRYERREYLALLAEYAPAAAARKRNPAHAGTRPTSLGPGGRLLLTVVGSLVFWWKRLRIGDCHFSVDARGIRRRSRSQEVCIAWTEVLAVRKLRHAWMIELDRGALPIPIRCIPAGQEAALAALFERNAACC